jgi:hypothetical protein
LSDTRKVSHLIKPECSFAVSGFLCSGSLQVKALRIHEFYTFSTNLRVCVLKTITHGSNMAGQSQQFSPRSNGISADTSDARQSRGQSIKVFRGCSRISDYDQLDKLGEGTFGYVIMRICLAHGALGFFYVVLIASLI